MAAIVGRIAAPLRKKGLDIVKSFQTEWYNGNVQTGFQMNNFGSPTSLGILVGNTREIWTPFIDWLAQNPTRVIAPDPFDTYVTEQVNSIVSEHIKDVRTEIKFSHGYKAGHGVAMQKLAHAAGLCYLDPEFHLAIHPVYGPWIAFRAAISVDIDASDQVWTAASNPVPDEARTEILSKFAEAMRETRARNPERWKYWAEFRKSIPVGQDFRYSDLQILYHHTGDKSVLAHAILERQKELASSKAQSAA
eukprot:TRINITY_DN7579_c0_g1_i1.p1 TRINITY_DN7579_c0_g1~~TRINITY_DN7579_c0_g1_i1.p1  ORF type:complete len:258 (-),score=27.13 TRINITY_DN7579_c0_g1_i1:110-856(-)